RPLVLPVLGASANSVIYAHCRAELANLYGLSRAAGLQYHLTALRQEFPPLDTSVSFDPQGLNQLYAAGGRPGTDGPVWMWGRPVVDVRPADARPRRRRLHSHRCEAPHSTRRALGTDPGWELICGAGGRIVTSEAAEECPMPDTDFPLEKAEADFGFSTLPG